MVRRRIGAVDHVNVVTGPPRRCRDVDGRFAPAAGPACVGIDLAGVDRVETGVAILRAGRLEWLGSASDDRAVWAAATSAGRGAIVAINAPLTRPIGRCCLDDDCPCRADPGTRSRAVERELARRGVPTLATALIKILARRGRSLALALRLAGYDPIEVYPFASLKLLGLPCSGKKTPSGRAAIHRALRRRVPGLNHPSASEHQLDAVVCAYTAHLWRLGRASAMGDPAEGQMIVPSACRKAVRDQ